MKTVKITLAVIVVSVITISVIWGFMSLSKSDEIQLPKNQYTKKIEQKIDSLKKMPESSFCKKFYDEIKYYIEDDYANNKLGKSQSENDQWKKNLSSNLYAAYSDKFIKQAFYVFKGSGWEVQKLNFILQEYQVLQKDGYKTGMLEKDSNTDKEFNDIKNIFAKYNEIANFISSCKGFSFKEYESLNTEFPISKVEKDIIRSEEYLKNNLGNNYVNNCIRLKSNLKEVPQILFYAHVNYLDNKITLWNSKYDNYSSQKEYFENLFSPLKNETEKLYSGIYKVNSLDTEYKKLDDKLKLGSSAAYQHFNSINQK
jgi:hypothetical protein